MKPWRHARGALALDPCRVMAVVNLTPDSFFDGGRWIAEARTRPNSSVVVNQCLRWVDQGAAILDIGGESTRPGAEPVSTTIEIARILPVLEALDGLSELKSTPLSVDTRHAEVARAALNAGAAIINDVSGLADPEMAGAVARAGAGLVIGHMRGEPATMMADIGFQDLLGEVVGELQRSRDRALRAGVAPDQILVDPGIGFGKTAAQSAALVAASAHIESALGCGVVIGASRKRFLGSLSGGGAVETRMLASVTAATSAARHGAVVVRVHDVPETVEALRVQVAIESEYAAAIHRSSAVRSER